MIESLPHGDYMAAVAVAFTAAGIEPDTWWIETPDGAQLDAVFTYPADYTEHVPRGAFLGWDQYGGWIFVETDDNRNLTTLDIDGYAHPDTVAAHTRALLNDQPTPTGDAPVWDQAAATEAAITAWDKE